jgi:hypothetical protein
MLPKAKSNPVPPPRQLKINQLSQIFITVNNTKCPNTKMKTVIGAVTLKTILCTLLHNMFRWLPQYEWKSNRNYFYIMRVHKIVLWMCHSKNHTTLGSCFVPLCCHISPAQCSIYRLKILGSVSAKTFYLNKNEILGFNVWQYWIWWE